MPRFWRAHVEPIVAPRALHRPTHATIETDGSYGRTGGERIELEVRDFGDLSLGTRQAAARFAMERANQCISRRTADGLDDYSGRRGTSRSVRTGTQDGIELRIAAVRERKRRWSQRRQQCENEENSSGHFAGCLGSAGTAAQVQGRCPPMAEARVLRILLCYHDLEE